MSAAPEAESCMTQIRLHKGYVHWIRCCQERTDCVVFRKLSLHLSFGQCKLLLFVSCPAVQLLMMIMTIMDNSCDQSWV